MSLPCVELSWLQELGDQERARAVSYREHNSQWFKSGLKPDTTYRIGEGYVFQPRIAHPPF